MEFASILFGFGFSLLGLIAASFSVVWAAKPERRVSPEGSNVSQRCLLTALCILWLSLFLLSGFAFSQLQSSETLFISFLVFLLGLSSFAISITRLNMEHETFENNSQNETKSLNSDLRLKTILNHLPASLAYIDNSRNYSFRNTVHLEVFGSKQGDQTVESVLGRKSFLDLQKGMNRAFLGRKSTGEYNVDLGESKDRDILVSYVPDKNSDGKVEGVFEMIQDLTDQRRAYASLAQARQELQDITKIKLIIEEIDEAICIFNKKMKIEMVNKKFETLFEVQDSSEVATPFLEFFVGNVRNQISKFIEHRDISKGATINFDTHAIRLGGEVIPVSLSINSSTAEGGDIYVGVIRDHAKQKEIENNLRKAKQIAEKTAKEKSYFLATMSHEIRTPLNGIIGLSECLYETGLDASQREMVQAILESGETLLNILNDILDISKIEQNKVSIESINFSIHELIKSTQNLLQPLADEKGIKLSSSISNSVPGLIVGDPNRLRQITTNLISNGIKFTTSGGVNLQVSALHRNEEHIDLTLSVQDTGMGISKSEQKKLFQSFSQVDSSIARLYGGTGLGLAITKGLVELMKGSIWVESKKGHGSTFFVSFPTQIAKEFRKKEKESNATATDENHALTVLIVDDNPINRKVLINKVHKMGVFSVVATNGQEAIDKCVSKEFDLIFMDIHMPVLSGIEAAKQILEFSRENPPSIIALTADVLISSRKEALQVGMVDWISKPIRMAELHRVFQKHLNGEYKNGSYAEVKETEANSSILKSNDFAEVHSCLIFDSNLLLKEFKGDEDYLAKMINRFILHKSDILMSIADAIDDANFKEVFTLVHGLKNELLNLEASRSVKVCNLLEQAAKQNDFLKCDEGLKDLARQLNQLSKDLSIFLENQLSFPRSS